MEECIFCRIIKKELPSEIVYEDDEVVAFLTIGPVNKGHTLVVPKKHVVNLFDMDEATVGHVFSAVKKLVHPVTNAFNAHGANVSINNNEASGQIVMHAHAHIIPRYSTDKLAMWPHKTYADGEMKETGEKIRKELQA
ncbi:MAG: HIT family protein [Nanoarchaeota archaeon]